jgi:trehalose/maltose hydrolase-like predicted phosphorylase
MRKDDNWLRTIGYPMLQGIADFWVSRSTVVTNADGTIEAHINDVIPPDEYVDHVNDSVYTNFVAAQSLRFAVSAAGVLGMLHRAAWRFLGLPLNCLLAVCRY